MAKVIGFDAGIAKQQDDVKREAQRQATHKRNTAHIKTIKNSGALKHNPFDVLKGG